MVKGKLIEQGAKEKKESCFTIGPFGCWFDKKHKDFFCPVLDATGLIPRRADRDRNEPSLWQFRESANKFSSSYKARLA